MLRIIAFSCLMIAPAMADVPDLRAPDQVRIGGLNASFGIALREALASGDTSALAVMEEAMRGTVLPVGNIAPEGDWACRTVKLGNGVPAVAYGKFRCRIEAVGSGQWRLTKLTGSQRVTGDMVFEEGGVLVFRGVGHVGDAPAVTYADLPPEDQTPMEPNQTTADVGVFEQMSADRARLLLPAPLLESHFDILYLTR